MDENCVSEVASNGNGISCLAFQLWEEAGCPEGRYLEFWMGAETRRLVPQRPEAIKVTTDRVSLPWGKQSFAVLKAIQARESTLTPVSEEILYFRPSSHWGINE